MIRFRNRTAALVFIGFGLFFNQRALAQNRAQNCLDSIFQSLSQPANRTREKLARFGEEVKHDGYQRFFIKNLPKVEVVSDKKLFGILRATEKSDEHWFWRLDTDLLQFVSRKVTKAIYKKSYDVLPIGRLLYAEIERSILPVGKTVTSGWKFGGAVALYPLSFWGLSTLVLQYEEKEKRANDLDYLIDEDYRFRSIKNKYGDAKARKGHDEEARREAVEIRSQYETYFSAMKTLHDQGVDYTNPLATMTLFSDSTLLSKVGPLFIDVKNVMDPTYYRNKPYLDVTHLKKPDAQLVHDLTILIHQRLMIEATADELFSGKGEVPEALRSQFDQDAFYLAVKKKLIEKKITVAEAIETFDERIHWRTRMKMYEVAGVTAFQLKGETVTADTLRIGDLEKEILNRLSKKSRKSLAK
jgi:hypothetical protein